MNDLKNLSEASVLTDELTSKSNDNMKNNAVDLKEVKKHFSKIGLCTLSYSFICIVIQMFLTRVATIFWPEILEHSFGKSLIKFAETFLITYPIVILLFRKVPAKTLEKHNLKLSQYIVIAIIFIFMTDTGCFLGVFVTKLLKSLFGVSVVNPTLKEITESAFSLNSLLANVLFNVVSYPVIEEYIFRKKLIDRMHMYGQKLAVITSALMFGLAHGNLYQCLHSFTSGLVYGYIYLKTGKLRYSIGLHMFNNFIGGVITPIFEKKIAAVSTMKNLEMPWLIGVCVYVLVCNGLTIAGLILLYLNKDKVSFEPSEMELPKKSRFKTVYMNTGMILFVVFYLTSIITYIVHPV